MRSRGKAASVILVMMLTLVLLAGCGGKKVTLRRITYDLPNGYTQSSKNGADSAIFTSRNGFEDSSVLRFSSSLGSLYDSSTFDKECVRYADSCLKSIPEVNEYTIVTNAKTEWLGMPAIKFYSNAVSNTGNALVVEGIFAYDVDNNAIYSISLTRPSNAGAGDFDSILSKASIN